MFLLYTSQLFSILENKLFGYADDFTLMAVVPSLGVRVTVAEYLFIGKVSGWCDILRLKLNASKTKTMIVCRSRTMNPQSLPLMIGRSELKKTDDLDILGVAFNSKMAFNILARFHSNFSKVWYLEEVLAIIP